MTFWAVTIAVLFITVIPLILGIKAYKSEKMRYGYIGVVISIAGIALSLHLANIWQILPDYGVAKFFFVVGMRNPNVNEVKSLAEDITKFAKTKYPELVLPVVEKPVGKFNQYMAQNHMLIEVGSNGTSSEEAKASAKYIAEILDEYFKQNR